MNRSAGRRVTEVLDALAVGWLVSITALLCWSMLPMAFGWRPHIVLTPSMAPRIKPGDVVLTAPATRIVRRGTVVVVKDTQVNSGQVLHRVTGTDALGRLITKGDANQSEDSTHRSPQDVLGVGRLVVPSIGTTVLVLRGTGTPADWVWVGATLAACGVLARPSASQGLQRQ